MMLVFVFIFFPGKLPVKMELLMLIKTFERRQTLENLILAQ